MDEWCMRYQTKNTRVSMGFLLQIYEVPINPSIYPSMEVVWVVGNTLVAFLCLIAILTQKTVQGLQHTFTEDWLWQEISQQLCSNGKTTTHFNKSDWSPGLASPDPLNF